MILEWIENNHATPVLVGILRTFGGEHGWYRDNRTLPEEFRTLSPHDFSEVLSATVRDIEEQAQSGSLLGRDSFDDYLYLWWFAAGDEGPPREYLVSIIGTERGLPELLLSYVTRTDLAFRGRPKNPEAGEQPQLRVQILEDLGLVDAAGTRAEELLREHPEQVSEEDRVLLQAFVNWYSSGGDARQDSL